MSSEIVNSDNDRQNEKFVCMWLTKRNDGQTNGQTDDGTDGRTDGRTDSWSTTDVAD